MKHLLQYNRSSVRFDARGISRGEREKRGKGESPPLPFPLSPLLLCDTPGFRRRASGLILFGAFLLSALIGGAPRAFAFPGAAAFELLPAAQVDSAGIFLHQIATASQSVLPPQPIRLADAPAFGQAASLSRAQIRELLKANAPEFAPTDWLGAAQVRVTRRARGLNERELRELLSATLQKDFVKDKGDLELRFTRPWASVFVPDETLVLKVIDLPATGVSAHFIVRFELFAMHIFA